jgi:hypothetical protein
MILLYRNAAQTAKCALLRELRRIGMHLLRFSDLAAAVRQEIVGKGRVIYERV